MSTFLGKYDGTWSNFAELFAKGQLVYGDWFEHVRGYWELSQQNPEQVLFISYEELKIVLYHNYYKNFETKIFSYCFLELAENDPNHITIYKSSSDG